MLLWKWFRVRQSDEENQIHLHLKTIYQCYVPYPACTKQITKHDRYQIVNVCRENKSHHPYEGLSCDTRGFFNVVRNSSTGNKKYRSYALHAGIPYLRMQCWQKILGKFKKGCLIWLFPVTLCTQQLTSKLRFAENGFKTVQRIYLINFFSMPRRFSILKSYSTLWQ